MNNIKEIRKIRLWLAIDVQTQESFLFQSGLIHLITRLAVLSQKAFIMTYLKAITSAKQRMESITSIQKTAIALMTLLLGLKTVVHIQL